MAVVSLLSCSGAPGVTTVALATTAGLTATTVAEPVMVELATSGGVLASQYDLPSEPGLMSLALAIGNDYPDLLEHAQELPGGVPVIVAPPSSSKTSKLLEARAGPLARYLDDVPATIVADCGRVSPTTSLLPLLKLSSLIGLVVRPSRESFQLAATTMAELNDRAGQSLPVGWVLVGPCPWPHSEIASLYGLPVLSAVPDDRTGAEAVAGLRRLRKHSQLARTARSFAEDIAKHLRLASGPEPLSYLEEPGRVDDEPVDGDEPTGQQQVDEEPLDEQPSDEERSAPAPLAGDPALDELADGPTAEELADEGPAADEAVVAR
jgi:hypothetical protein